MEAKEQWAILVVFAHGGQSYLTRGGGIATFDSKREAKGPASSVRQLSDVANVEIVPAPVTQEAPK